MIGWVLDEKSGTLKGLIWRYGAGFSATPESPGIHSFTLCGVKGNKVDTIPLLPVQTYFVCKQK
jgi:hypothetical protein